jgi:hypothetical protein
MGSVLFKLSWTRRWKLDLETRAAQIGIVAHLDFSAR